MTSNIIRPIDAVKKLRDAGYTQEQIRELVECEGVACGQSTICRIEIGKTKMCNFDLYEALLKVLEKYKEKTTA